MMRIISFSCSINHIPIKNTGEEEKIIVGALLMEVAGEYKKSVPQEAELTLAEQIVKYIAKA